ncbi:hypothetical protein SF83666_a42590 (plasmid) [Sinorhizobium fredii CCBAU 83666]|nr:hypothetical protein SF83666_a42590 [Sinorhizobium fredii CCBAU 83666]
MATAPPGCGQACRYSFRYQGSFVLGERAENVEQELWRCGVHLFGQRTESDTTPFQFVDKLDQMRQGASHAVELPHYQHLAGSQFLHASFQTGPIIAGAEALS